MSLREWVDGVLSFDTKPEEMRAAELVGRCRELAAEMPVLGLSQEELQELCIGLAQGLGTKFLFADLRRAEPGTMRAAHDLICAFAETIVDDAYASTLHYFWDRLVRCGWYWPIIIEWMRTERERVVYSEILALTRLEQESDNSLVVSAGRIGYSLFRGAAVDESLEGLPWQRLITEGYGDEHLLYRETWAWVILRLENYGLEMTRESIALAIASTRLVEGRDEAMAEVERLQGLQRGGGSTYFAKETRAPGTTWTTDEDVWVVLAVDAAFMDEGSPVHVHVSGVVIGDPEKVLAESREIDAGREWVAVYTRNGRRQERG